MANRFGRRNKKAADDEATGAARDEQAVAVEEAAEAGLADDAPEAVTTGTESVAKATEPETVVDREIDDRFDGQDIGQEDQLAAAIGQTKGDDDPLAAQFGDIDTALGDAGRDRLAELAADLVPDDGTDAGPKYGKDMLAADGDQTVVSGHPGAYGVVWKDGEVTDHYATSPVDDDGTFLGIDVAAMAYEKEMTKKAEEVQQTSGSGGSGGSGSGTGGTGGTGSGTGGTGGTGSGTGGTGGTGGSGGTGSGTGGTTVDNGDGTFTTTYPDNTTITTGPDGQAVIHPDGSMDIYDKDGNLVEHHDPPPADPPAEDPPPEDKKPAEDPPPEDKPDGEGSTESQPDEDYVDPETERLFREELAKDPGYAHYQKQRGADGAIDPADDQGNPTTPVGESTGELITARERYGMGGDPIGPEADVTGGGPSDAGYYDDPNHGAIDYEDTVHDGPIRNDDPFDGVGATPKSPASAEAEDSDEAVDSFLPPSAIAGRVDDGPDIPDAVLDEPVP